MADPLCYKRAAVAGRALIQDVKAARACCGTHRATRLLRNSTLSIYAQSKFQRTTLSVVLTSIEVDSDSDFRIFWIEI